MVLACWSAEPALQVPGFGGHVEPVVIAPVHGAHGSRYELGRRQIVERRERNGYVIAADLLDVAIRVDPYATAVAEDMMVVAAFAEGILTGVLFAGKQTERVGLDSDRPGAHLPAVAAVDPARAPTLTFGRRELLRSGIRS